MRFQVASVVGLITAIVAVGGIASPAVAATSEATPLVTGTVHSPGGTALSRQEVLLIAEPTGSQLSALAVGQSTSAAVVATTQTNSDGSYAIPTPDPASFSQKVDKTGNVQFTVMTWPVESAGSVFAFGRTYSSTTHLLSAPQTADPTTSGTSVSNSAAESTVTTPVSANLVTSTSTNAAADQSRALTSAQPDSYVCQSTNEGSKNADTSVAKFYSTVTQGKGSGTYDSSATSTLGVAVSTNGTAWTASGSSTATNTNSTSESAGSVTGQFNTAANSYFEFMKVKEVCTDLDGGSTTTTWQTRETQYNGGLHYASLSSYPSTPYCEPVSAGYSITKTSSSASTFSGGVSVSDFIGINLNSQSGYSSKVKVTLTLTGATARICGTTDYPAASPGVIALRAP